MSDSGGRRAGSEWLEQLASEVEADKKLRGTASDPIAAKIRELRRRNLQASDGSAGEPVYRGFSSRVMTCAMAAAWTFGQLSGKQGDDFEFWFRKVVNEHFVDGEIVGLAEETVACAEFVVEQIMAVTNEPYETRSVSEWAYGDIARLCSRLAAARRDAARKARGSDSSSSEGTS